jgi:hypothetical protein
MRRLKKVVYTLYASKAAALSWVALSSVGASAIVGTSRAISILH